VSDGVSLNLSPPATQWFDALPNAVVITVNGVIRYINAEGLQQLDAEHECAVLGRNVMDFVHPLDQSRMLTRRQRFLNHDTNPTTQVRTISLKGRLRIILLSSVSVSYQDEDAVLMTGVDFSEHSRMQEELRQSELQFRTLFENMQDVYYRTDATGIVQMVGPAVRRVIGYTPEEVIGSAAEAYYPSPADCDALKHALQLHGEINDFPGQMVHKNGSIIDISISSRALYDEYGKFTGVEGVYRDVTQRKNLERELTRLATIDSLTGIENRRAFLEKAGQIFRSSQRYLHGLALVMLDIDHFKSINDQHGHLGGDRVLTSFAEIVKRELRESDVFGRLGGEEFCVLLQQTQRQEAQHVCERILQKVRAAVIVVCPGTALSLTVSLGVSSMRDSDDKLERILERADQALYRAKRLGRNRVAWDC
jgi:diguanylate cyclase (GGDEF)-like protein/PAS domain S-box-containing protein